MRIFWNTERRYRDLAGWVRFCHRKKRQKITSSNQPRTPPNAQMEGHCHEMLLSFLLNRISTRIVPHGHHGDRRCAGSPSSRRLVSPSRPRAARGGCCWLIYLVLLFLLLYTLRVMDFRARNYAVITRNYTTRNYA